MLFNQKKYYLLSFITILAGALFFYSHIIIHSVSVRITGDYIYAIILMLLFFAFIFLKWGDLKKLVPEPQLGMASFFLLLNFLFYWSYIVSGMSILAETALILFLVGMILFLLGKRYLQNFLVLLLIIFVWLGSFDQILNQFSWYFQRITAILANGILNGVGFPTILSGVDIELPHLILVVAPTCNGIKQILVLVIIALFIASIQGFILIWHGLSMIFAFIVGLLINAVRVAAIGIWTYYFPSMPTHGPANIFYSTFVFMIGTIIVIGFLTYFGRKIPTIRRPVETSQFDPSKVKAYIRGIIYLFAYFAVVYGSMLMLVPKEQILSGSLAGIPYGIMDWYGKDCNPSFEPYEIELPSEEIRRTYINAQGDSIDLYVVYLARQMPGREVVNYFNLNLFNNSVQYDLKHDKTAANSINVNHAEEAGVHYYFCYFSNEEQQNNPFMAKWASIRQSLSRRTNSGTLLLLRTAQSFQKNPTDRDRFIGSLLDYTTAILKKPVNLQ